ncbi:MAG TPA: hypothetical protein GX700_17540, partial [Paracoccus sp.]|nr:hypothetical protein [Paracoccus sp. (in: a-proteobacteria)]
MGGLRFPALVLSAILSALLAFAGAALAEERLVPAEPGALAAAIAGA